MEPIIGTAWSGKHVVIILCHYLSNQVLSLSHSSAAPLEPYVPNCAETLSRFLSIGYSIEKVVSMENGLVQYILVRS